MMRLFMLALVLFCAISCKQAEPAATQHVEVPATLQIQTIDTFAVQSSVRALEVVDAQTIWWAGSEGRYGFTTDGGQHWTIDSLRLDTLVPHFRAIAVTQEAVFLLSIASPALLFRSTDQGQNWDLVYREEHPAAFYDAMAFWDQEHGIAMGDPTDGCLSVILTQDGGKHWTKVDCNLLPPTAEGEAAFAASNSNIALFGQQAWLVSGGKKARVFHSPDRGQSWSVYETPIAQGGQMTGIFSADFYDEQQGIIFGGDWNEKDRNSGNKATSKDGGRTWQLLVDGEGPGYQSCIRYLPESEGKALLSCGIPGINYSADAGQSWQKLSQESWYTLRFGPTWQTTWLAGNGKIGRINWQDIPQ